MKYFVVSDVHGYCDVLVSNLIEEGFDILNDNHKVIIVGDLVDRGPQNKELLEFVYDLYTKDKVLLVKGNHDQFLINFFEKNFNRTAFDILKNGHGETLSQLCEKEITTESDFTKESVLLMEKYQNIYEMLVQAPHFLEIGDYIFVHGGVDGSLDDWRKDTARNYTWNRQHQMKKIKGKTVVCGHTQNVYIAYPDDYKKYLSSPELYPEKFGIIYNEGVIHIDGSVHTTKKVNVLKLDI